MLQIAAAQSLNTLFERGAKGIIMARSSGTTRRATQKRSSSRTRRSKGRATTSQSRSGASSEMRSQTRSSSTGRARHTEKVTTNHDEIRRWAEQRGAKPARVAGTGGNGDVGLIRLMFPGAPGSRDDKLEEISWDEWFRKFAESGLAFVYDETTSGGQKSNFNKLVKRETAKAKSRAAGAGR